MSKKNFTIIATAFVAVSLFSVGTSYARSSVGNAVDSYCASRGLTPYGGNCDLCHNDNTNYNHARSGDYDWFCPAPTVPTCTDNDGDTYAVQGGSCGPVDCNDNNRAVRPGATENCTDGFDNNCNSLIDRQDPAAVGCPTLCTDNDGDGYAADGGTCGPADCDDSDAGMNPGAAEICDDGIDNDCDDAIDEGCDTSCPDVDGDGYVDAACGGDDCDDDNAALNPGATEVCGNRIDENCNGASDDVCVTTPPSGGDDDGDDGDDDDDDDDDDREYRRSDRSDRDRDDERSSRRSRRSND
jgi:hypothetical protein